MMICMLPLARSPLNAPVAGDLIAAGGTITVNDTVTQEILVAGVFTYFFNE